MSLNKKLGNYCIKCSSGEGFAKHLGFVVCTIKSELLSVNKTIQHLCFGLF